ncbi:hypothetical protein V498_05641 [Pseudogymnoascus sp. VKM F-4517 (FW-2822)]|nr:hypothetical protein V498_05641 [Pseudogymnoascus sp. VKM F-4517 (FW-2822)]
MDSPALSPEAIAFAARIYDAARAGQIDLFEQALPAGLPANMTNEKGDSLQLSNYLEIMLAAYHGHSQLVRLLISHGANPNSLNDRGQSPLAGAVFKNESEVVKVLLEGGADPDYGAPSAMEAIVLFKKEDQWRNLFEEAPGKGKAVATLTPPS